MAKRAFLLLIAFFAVLTPFAVTGNSASAALSPITSVVAGYNFSCSLDSAGQARCWGSNSNGQLGNGTNTDSKTPVLVSGGPWIQIAAGNTHACGITSSNDTYCWGYNGYGVLGNGGGPDSSVPVLVSGGRQAKQVVVSSDATTCYLTTAGAAYCWGYGADGRLGNGTASGSSSPAAVVGGKTFTSITYGIAHGCGLVNDSTTWCWGRGDNGGLGNGGTANSNTPVQVIGGLTFTSITASNMRSCGLVASGAAYCWGDSYGTTGPVAVAGSNSFSSIVSSSNSICGITVTGAGMCWINDGNGQFGNGTTSGTPSLNPTTVSGGYKFTSMAIQNNAVCGLTDSTQLYCWGYNASGLGDDAGTTSKLTPLMVWGYVASGAVTVGATVDPTFVFTVSSRSTACNGLSSSAGSSSASSSLTLGHATVGTLFASQSLTASSNAVNGFIVQIRGSALTNGANTFANVSGTNATPAAFGASPAFGYTVGAASQSRFNAGLFAALSATNATILSGTSSDSGCVGFQSLIGPNTPAGTYIGSVVYTAIPSF